ncbi:OmpA family protein [Sandaracinus amylolyticus]|uniref:Outer membrane protein n=1 Tax=Sandaracinus amylolyticus TaxID=927083 RepID=A0A0F6SGZ1_9BACT|nr:OmpA family protein [Sandaracinus amylolyticus]AKF09534.1 Outer membrane protein [Sandaracinus amylolyticus]
MDQINRKTMTGAVLGGALLTGAAIAGCGAAAPTPQLQDARATMLEARESSAARLKPDGLLIAQRTLEAAEASEDGSRAEAHYAYIAERQTRVAMAEARQIELEQQMAADRARYGAELEEIARSRGATLQERERALAEQRGLVAQQQQQLEQSQQALAAEQQARMQAEQRAQESMDRLRELAAVRQEREETIITLSGEVIFETDSANLRGTARERLLAVADALRAAPDRLAVVEGHTDSRGSDSYNQQLSQRRAEAVRDYLIAEGVPAARLQAVGRGEAEPVDSNDSAEGRANNRRVEIHLQAMPGGAQQQR